MIFVFGSNLAGRHGKGAALYATKQYGAKYGVGEGISGNSYAIPTKDERLCVIPWSDVCKSIDTFLEYVTSSGKTEIFLLTPIGCGLAGYRASDLYRYLQKKGLPNNVVLSSSWVNDHTLTK